MKFKKASLLVILFFIFFFLPQKIFAADRFISYKITDQIPVESIDIGEEYLEKELYFNYVQGTVSLSTISGGNKIDDLLVSDAIDIVVERPDGYKSRWIYSFVNRLNNCLPVNYSPENADITSLFAEGLNIVTIKIYSVCSDFKSSPDLYLVNNVDRMIYSTDFLNPHNFESSIPDWDDGLNAYQSDALYSVYKYIKPPNQFYPEQKAVWSEYDLNIPSEAIVVGVVPFIQESSKYGVISAHLILNGEKSAPSRSMGYNSLPLGPEEYLYPLSSVDYFWTLSSNGLPHLQGIESLGVEFKPYASLSIVSSAIHNINWVPIKVYYELPEEPDLPPPPPFNGKVLNVPSFKQGIYPFDNVDPIWEVDNYDSSNMQSLWCGSALYQCGCAMTSASMVLSYFGINFDSNGNSVNPQSLNNYFSQNPVEKNGIVTSWGYYYGDFRWNRLDDYTALANRIYPEQTKLDQPIIEDYSFEGLKSYIDQDLPVILKVVRQNGGIHYVLAKGYEDDNKIIINDPAKADPLDGYQYLVDYTPAMTRSMIIYKPTHSDFSNIEILIPHGNQILLIDKEGRKTGYDSNLNQVFEEIPNSSYFYVDPISDITNENPIPENSGFYNLVINLPETGEFEIVPTIVSPQSSDYSIYVSDSDANSKIFNFELNQGSNEEFEYFNSPDNQLTKIVGLNIRPWNEKNIINTKSSALIPLVIYGESDFNVRSIKVSSVRFGDAKPYKPVLYKKFRDLNHDGIKDMILRFKQNKINIEEGQTELCVNGETKQELKFKGCDYILAK